VLRAVRNIEARNSGDSSPEEIAQLLDKPIEQVRELLALNEHTASLDAPLEIDPGLSMGETLADELSPSPETQLQITETQALVDEWLGQLNGRQRTVIEWRYGLNGREARTLEDLADLLELTRERVRQIQLEALAQLRRILRRAGISKDALW